MVCLWVHVENDDTVLPRDATFAATFAATFSAAFAAAFAADGGRVDKAGFRDGVN